MAQPRSPFTRDYLIFNRIPQRPGVTRLVAEDPHRARGGLEGRKPLTRDGNSVLGCNDAAMPSLFATEGFG